MKDRSRKPLTFTKSIWKNKELSFRSDRINIKLNVNHKKPDEKFFQKTIEEIRTKVVGSEVLRSSIKLARLVLKVPEGTDIVKLADDLSKFPGVVYAEPDVMTIGTVAPNDTKYAEQWGLAKINAEGAWDLEKGGSNVLIGIIDSGISIDGGALSHSDLNDTARYILGTDFVEDDGTPQDEYGHGTHVAGIAAAETDNSDGVSGLNWNSKVYICRTLDDNNSGSSSDFEAAVQEIVDYAIANNLKAIMNYSAGGADNNTKEDACRYASDNGMILCAATGNDNASPVISPAMHSVNFVGVIAVGATDEDDNVAGFSNVGPEVTVVAPGVEILSTFPTYDVNGDTAHDYVSWDGTSMATPHVTGLASLVWSHVTQLTNEQVRDVIVNTAVKLGSGSFDNSWGNGRINAAEAVAKAGWELTPVQLTLNFVDIPEGETQLRAIRIDVKSFHITSFEMTVLPTAPFEMYNYTAPFTIGKSTDYDAQREAYLWVKYTGTTAGDTASGTARVKCLETGDEYDVTITANTIARPTCAMMLVLDKSGSMLEASGVGSLTREDVLKDSANIFMTYVREGNGVGMVTFDQDAQDLLVPLEGPFGPPDDPFDLPRANAISALGTYAANPSGLTAIGDGIERGHDKLSAVTGYDKKAIIVFTDGHETASKYISDVSGLINEEVFAVGLGTASELSPSALTAICNGHNGYLLLTDELDSDDTFKLAKYFLQIQAGVNNEQVVVDPSGYVAADNTVKIPFYVNETDISVDAIVMMPVQHILNVALQTPAGDVISATNLASFPTVKMISGAQVTYYRMTLPVSNGATVQAHTGKWAILLKVDKKYYKKYLSEIENQSAEYRQATAHGIKYTALVHAYSNLRMNCTLSQSSYEPGGTVHLRCVLTEYGVALQKASSVTASSVMPDGSTSTVILNKLSNGIYGTSLTASLSGVYTFTIKASGHTSRNASFTREQVLTAGVWKGGDQPPRTSGDAGGSGNTQETICKLLNCMSKNINTKAREKLLKDGYDVNGLLKCFCPKPPVKRTK